MNLKNGLPFPTDSVEFVYHSHLLEHLDRNEAPGFLREILRVLMPGGIQRIVVPDFEHLCRSYVDHIDSCDADQGLAAQHDKYIESVLEQSVRREAFSTARQPRIQRVMENLILGDARQRGETHQWMYDRISLSVLLSKVGYTDITLEEFNTSRVNDWHMIGLDLDEDGKQYKPGSLYMEAAKST